MSSNICGVLVASKYSVGSLDVSRHSGVPWELHNWIQTGGIVQRTFCEAESFHCTEQWRYLSPFIKYYYWRHFFKFYFGKLFSVQTNVARSLSTIFILILSSRIMPKTTSPLNPSGTSVRNFIYLRCKDTHIKIYIFDQHDLKLIL
jgi:hypothetical protein